MVGPPRDWTTSGRTGRRDRTDSLGWVPAALEVAIVALRRTRATAWQISTALRVPALDRHASLGADVGLNRLALGGTHRPGAAVRLPTCWRSCSTSI